MKPLKLLLPLLPLMSLVSAHAAICANHDAPEAPPAPYGPLPTAAQMEWQKMEYNMFIHFGPNTFYGSEWGSGEEKAALFDPTALDCDQWAATAKAAGMQAIIITAKHHDGFCLWPSATSTHTVAQSPWRGGKGDLLRELSDACRAHGLKFGVYLSPWDRNHPAYGTPAYNEVFCGALAEVLGNYGPVFEQWFDGACGEGPGGKRQEYDWQRFRQTVYRYQPDAVIFSDVGPGCRWIGNERGYAGEKCWSRLDTAGFSPGAGAPASEVLNSGQARGAAWIPGEADVSIRPGWFYHADEDSRVKSVGELMEIYYGSVGRNALLLLNVPPDKRGLLPSIDSLRLLEFRAARERAFAIDLAAGARAEVSSVRGNAKRFAAQNVLDAQYDTYWTPAEEVGSATGTANAAGVVNAEGIGTAAKAAAPMLEIALVEARTFDCILLQEYIPLGQRVEHFTAEYLSENGEWVSLAEGTTVGYKRIVRFEPVTAQRVRIRIDRAAAVPLINRVSLYRVGGQDGQL